MRLLWESAVYKLKNEGLPAFVKQVIAYIRYQLFFYRTYDLLEIPLIQLYDLDIAPMTDDCSFKIISSNRQVQELTMEGYKFHPWYPVYRHRLDKGAIAFCVFVGTELGHVSWCAMSAGALKSLGEPPLKVDFANNELEIRPKSGIA